jgi:hypothetical protein
MSGARRGRSVISIAFFGVAPEQGSTGYRDLPQTSYSPPAGEPNRFAGAGSLRASIFCLRNAERLECNSHGPLAR